MADAQGEKDGIHEDNDGLWLACCSHCGCAPDRREGHDDSCALGCNDHALSPGETASQDGVS